MLNEANAISTTALRARLLPEPNRAETLKLLKEYVQIRLDIIPDRHITGRARGCCRSFDRDLGALWQQAKAMGRQRKRIDTHRAVHPSCSI